MKNIIALVALATAICGLALPGIPIAFAGGDWKNSPLRTWFEGLASKKGACCSAADGQTLTDAQWDVKDNQYRVFLDHQWIVIPDDAVVKGQNKYGSAVVWPIRTWAIDERTGRVGEEYIYIRCFLPAAMG
jgi:hypothetical protein